MFVKTFFLMGQKGKGRIRKALGSTDCVGNSELNLILKIIKIKRLFK